MGEQAAERNDHQETETKKLGIEKKKKSEVESLDTTSWLARRQSNENFA